MTLSPPVSPGQILTGSLFNEPIRVVTVQANGPSSWVVGLVGAQSERFRKVTLTADDFNRLTVLAAEHSFDGDARLFRLGVEAHASASPTSTTPTSRSPSPASIRCRTSSRPSTTTS